MAAEATGLLRARGLSQRYRRRAGLSPHGGAVVAVDHVDLDLPDGATVALVGGSGAGKSSLARCLARVEDPVSGEIWFEGRDIAALRGRALAPVRRRIQLIFQDSARALNPRLPAIEIVAEPWTILGLGKQERRRRARALMEQVGLPPSCESRRPLDLSGGERQRLAIARALAVEPRLLILDEAVSGLDASVQAQILNLVLDVQAARAMTTLHISHDLGLMARIAEEGAVMHAGRIVERGPVAELLSHPRHPETRALVSAIPAPHPAVAPPGPSA